MKILRRIIFIALCANYFFVIHGGGRWDQFPEENYFSALIKIIPTAGLMLLTWSCGVTDDAHEHLKSNVSWGLLFSVLGDIFMVWRFEKIVEGIFFFAIAHLFYARAFRFRPLGDIMSALIIMLPGILLAIFLVLPNIPETSVKIAGFCYSIVISIMWWRCVTYFRSTEKVTILRACVGAFLFMLSDFFICLDTWVVPLPFASLLIMTTYYTAQYLIASSVLEYKPLSQKER